MCWTLGEFGLGTGPLGSPADLSDAAAAAVLAAAWESGVRYFDTAPSYGDGVAELRLGHSLAGKERADFGVSTKVGRISMANSNPYVLRAGPAAVGVARFDFSADGVRRSLAGSLERLGLHYVDIAFLHDPDDFLDEAVGEALPELRRLRDEGAIRAVGVGTTNVEAALRLIDEGIDVLMLAVRFTLADDSGLPAVVAARERGVEVVAAAPFNSGLLATRAATAAVPFDYRAPSSETVDLVGRLASVCADHGVTLAQAALQFPLAEPAVSCVVAGARAADEVIENVRLLGEPVPAALWPALAAVSRGAPESSRA